MLCQFIESTFGDFFSETYFQVLPQESFSFSCCFPTFSRFNSRHVSRFDGVFYFFPHYPRNASIFFCVSSIFVCGCYATSLTLPVFSAHMPGKRILVPLPVDCILGGLLGVFFSFDSNLSHPHFFIRCITFYKLLSEFRQCLMVRFHIRMSYEQRMFGCRAAS